MGIFGPMDKDGESRFDSRLRKQQSVLQCKRREGSGKYIKNIKKLSAWRLLLRRT